jgi:hypothetical protein
MFIRGPGSVRLMGPGGYPIVPGSRYPLGATPELFPVNDAITEAAHHKALSDFFADAAAGTLPS